MKHLGLKKGVYTAWKSGLSTSYKQNVDSIAAFFDVSPTYLLRGKENSENVKYAEDEKELIRMYRFLSAESKTKIMRMVGTLAANA